MTTNIIEPVRDLDKMTAGFLRRAFALLIDYLILSPFILIYSLPYLKQWLDNFIILPERYYDPSLARFYQLDGIFFLYGFLMLGSYGRTLGMMLLGLWVTNPDGSRIGFGKAFLRTAAYSAPAFLGIAFYANSLISAILFAGTAIGLLWIMVDRAHQGYHDKIANTIVLLNKYYQAPDEED